MPWKDEFRRCLKGPYIKVFYIIGMLLIIIGIGSVTASIDPKPLPRSSWIAFLAIGLFFIVSGLFILVIVTKSRTYPVLSPSSINANDTVNSSADLLSDNLYNEVGNTSHATYENTVESLESVKAVGQCMMTSEPSPKTILFYKETFV